ncbi:ATP-binding protein [Paenibacillus sp. CF384]|uniref:ATP-binding protein n=1 Tax=Paenibacillus sp. CF384 TaxID=1884382 RepID=UPI00089C5493|nr:ATP-binding protein [Paenibacillus sp. CF384]SDW22346.1 Deoxyadenosine/deoxycytidine kinase [Paenibacillus sp. CF384]
MKRYVIITVGKTHSGKTTFAKSLEDRLPNSVVIDQDNHAAFLNTYYKTLISSQNSKFLKHAITENIIDYAIFHTDKDLILCNSNLDHDARKMLLANFHKNGFTSVLVYFDLPSHVLHERISNSGRSSVLNITVSFEDVLDRQEARYRDGLWIAPDQQEANIYFVISDSNQVEYVKQQVINITQAT